jgi:hypothetical protein
MDAGDAGAAGSARIAMNGTPRRIPFALRNALWLGLALLVLAAGVAAQIEQPGLYFDEVYVDYMVVPLVHPHSVELPAKFWLPPGNYLFGRFPLLVQLYHGALPLYLGLPLYALLGTEVAAVRIVHGLFAAAVLTLLWSLMRRANVPAWIAGLAAIALALDPAFLFAFRTQYYVLLVPLIPLLLGAVLAERARAAASSRARRWMMAGSGLLAGLACYGYFIYFALAPALAWLALRRSDAAGDRWPTRMAWMAGFAIGVAPYPIGLLLIVLAQGGLDAALAWARAYLAGLNSGMQFGGLLERLPYFFVQLSRMLTAEALTLDIFGIRTIAADGLASLPQGTPVGQTGAWIRLAGMIALAVGAAPFALRDRAGSAAIRFVLLCFAGLFVLALVFGKRLLPHHFMPAVPLLYALAAIGGAALCRRAVREGSSAARGPLRGVALAVGATLLMIGALNSVNRQAVFDRLAADDATWMFHPNVSRFAQAARAQSSPAYYFFPDWGLFTSFAMITRGAIPFWTEFIAARARANLCAGRDVVLVSTRPGQDARVGPWTDEIGWAAPRFEKFRQKDGRRIFIAVRWVARQGPREGRPCPQ